MNGLHLHDVIYYVVLLYVNDSKLPLNEHLAIT